MLSIFSLPKPFKGHIGIIQRNAVASWVKLGSSCEIVLFGDEEGIADTAKEFGVRHVPDVARNEHGTPLLNDVFAKAERIGKHDLLCYLNGDIILGSDFIQAVNSVRTWTDKFLLVGECWDVRVDEKLPFENLDWENHLRELVEQKGTSRGPWYIDYFAFNRGLYENLPPFAVGRAGFDNWLIWKARSAGAAVVDVTKAVKAVHQNHDYSHVAGGREWSYRGVEAKTNAQLAGGPAHLYMILDATHRLSTRGLKRNFGSFFRLRSRWEVGKTFCRAALQHWGWKMVEWTRPFRHALGLRKTNFTRLKVRLGSQKNSN